MCCLKESEYISKMMNVFECLIKARVVFREPQSKRCPRLMNLLSFFNSEVTSLMTIKETTTILLVNLKIDRYNPTEHFITLELRRRF